MTLSAGTLDTRALWYLTRGAGVVSLLLLTTVVVLGTVTTVRWSTPRWPRFVTMHLHRNVSLLAVVFVLIHVISAVTDPFAPLRITDAVIPLTSAYRPLWVGLGALAFDLLVALIVTSLLRHRLGHPRWRALHWLAYVCWPIAVLHGLGTGSDVRSRWLQAVTVACVLAVVAGVWWRIGQRWPERAGVRSLAALASIAVPVAFAGFTVAGPLKPGWARRSGTPASALAAVTSTGSTSATSTSTSTSQLPWTAEFNGSVAQTSSGTGTSVVRLSGSVSTSPTSRLSIVLNGQSLANGGVAMTSSNVTLATDSGTYTGQVSALNGGLLIADLNGPSGPVRLRLGLSLEGSAASGPVRVTSGGAA